MAVFVVTGATGHIGSEVAKHLLKAGHKVRAVVRNAEKAAGLKAQGAELCIGELTDKDALTKALRGADGAFIMQPPPPHDSSDPRAYQNKVTRAEADAVKASGLKHVVMLSSWGAEKEAGTGAIVGLNGLEKELRKTGAIITILRAGSFTENLLNMLPAVKHQGFLPTFLPQDLKDASIATCDIATVVVRSLLAPATATEIAYVLGTHAYNAHDHAAYLSKKLGKTVALREMPISGMAAMLAQSGMSQPMANLVQELYSGLVSGLIGVVPGHRIERGTTTLEGALDRYF